MGVRIIVDSAADIEEDYAAAHQISLAPLTIIFGMEELAEGIEISRNEFYERLIESDEMPQTSQVNPSVFETLFKDALKEGDEVLVITLSSKLSGTYQSACIAADLFSEEIFIVDSENVTVGERLLVERAVALRDEGFHAAEIAERLNVEKKDIHVVATLETLEYLRRGGRISGAAATVGGLLSIKPVIGIVDGEVAILGKARGSKQSKNMVFEKIAEAGGIDFTRPLWIAYSGLSDALARKYLADTLALAGSVNTAHVTENDVPITQVGAAIGTHAGPGAVAFAFFSA